MRKARVTAPVALTLAPDEERSSRMDRSCLLPMRCGTRRAWLWPLAHRGERSAWRPSQPATNRLGTVRSQVAKRLGEPNRAAAGCKRGANFAPVNTARPPAGAIQAYPAFFSALEPSELR